jgi:hypothetical protein
MKHLGLKLTVVATLVLLSIGSLPTRAQDDDERNDTRFFTRLSTFHEVPPKANAASGTFDAQLSEDGTTLNWTFTWTGLTGPPLFAHIHFGLPGGNYPVMTFFCGGPTGNPDIPQKPDCPQTTSGSITGTTTAADIIALNSGQTDQDLNLHDFAAFLRALRAGAGYANMHTVRFPGGEIRGQIKAHHRERDEEH